MDIKNSSIILYIKGTKDSPMCGFSARIGNVLENTEIRIRLSEYSDWTTIPQLKVSSAKF